ncbi:monothiol glutaredoxin-S15, mitochondrial-like isoform X1 [Camellia sinensis]|uniref:monothiol glutaredoxin-S15, mitochondrial-like isoform X1 n=1 Tax=Camellia sinensis TaxID=4442 RepID=UPI001036CBC9|nr:monothiol glutaredoxin-S15, mitochondrial-like isoform X1 [Camellia sinensis]
MQKPCAEDSLHSSAALPPPPTSAVAFPAIHYILFLLRHFQLRYKDVPLSARNILEDPELKNAVKAYSLMVYPSRNWPTFPQIFIKGEFIGGSDIILNMHQTGELKEMVKDIAAN